MRRPPTINGLCATGDATGGVATEISYELGNLFWLEEAANGSLCYHDLLNNFRFGNVMHSCLIGDLFLDKRSAHIGGADDVAGHAMLCRFQGRHSR